MHRSPFQKIVRLGNCTNARYGIDAIFVLMGLPSATLAWYKQPPAMRVCIKKLYKKITNRITIRMFKSIVKKKGDFNGK